MAEHFSRPLCLKTIQRYLRDETLRDRFAMTLFQAIPSTNDYLKENHDVIADKLPACIAEQQLAGRGRKEGREWYSPFGSNIYFSFVWSFSKPIHQLSALTLVISLAIIATLETFKIDNLRIKWPNDLYHQEKKFSGALIDVIKTTPSLSKVIIGIGINVNMTPSKQIAISQPWTSLQEILGYALDRNYVIAELIFHLNMYLTQYEKEAWSPFASEWQTYDKLYGKKLTFISEQGTFEGEGAGVNEKGQLLLKIANQTQMAFSAGDIFLKK